MLNMTEFCRGTHIKYRTWFILHARQSRKLRLFFLEAWEEGSAGASWTWSFSVKEKYLMLHVYSIQSQHLYCLLHLGCWNGQSFGPYFSSLLAIIEHSKIQGPCLQKVSNTHKPWRVISWCLTWRNYHNLHCLLSDIGEFPLMWFAHVF